MLWFCLSESFVLSSSCHVFVFLFVLFLLNFLVVFSSDDEGGWIQSQAGKSKSVMDCQHESFCLSFVVFVSRFLSGFCRLFDIFFVCVLHFPDCESFLQHFVCISRSRSCFFFQHPRQPRLPRHSITSWNKWQSKWRTRKMTKTWQQNDTIIVLDFPVFAGPRFS